MGGQYEQSGRVGGDIKGGRGEAGFDGRITGERINDSMYGGHNTFFSTISHLLPIKILFTDSVACCSMFLIQFLISYMVKYYSK